MRPMPIVAVGADWRVVTTRFGCFVRGRRSGVEFRVWPPYDHIWGWGKLIDGISRTVLGASLPNELPKPSDVIRVHHEMQEPSMSMNCEHKTRVGFDIFGTSAIFVERMEGYEDAEVGDWCKDCGALEVYPANGDEPVWVDCNRKGWLK